MFFVLLGIRTRGDLKTLVLGLPAGAVLQGGSQVWSVSACTAMAGNKNQDLK